MQRFLLRFQRELTVLAGVLIATGGFAFATLVSEGSRAVDAGTYVVRTQADGFLVTGEVVGIETNARGRTVTVVEWRMREGRTVTRMLRGGRPAAARDVTVTVTEPGRTVTQPGTTLRETETVPGETVVLTETVTDVQTVTSVQTVTVVATTPEGPDTVTPDELEAP